ncbi:ATP-binding protein [Umezawaea sp. Da 62-37]|uniref:ATP-binding protein n=1 Tax=Umezawaea sp. Da 62-37 TaxID=3075927 RepID=UPI0028F7369F|nr:ATP-binding protein [Umezawaea sp. Da 62-37]WNV85551.1 ATP-binding protein [Umezawaea sp. Da 62-37]
MLQEPPPRLSAQDHSIRMGEELTLGISLTCNNLGELRAELRQVLDGMDDDFVDDVQLVCTELAANACDHAEDPRQLVLRRQVQDDRHELLIEVHDSTPERTPLVGESTLGEFRGHGMRMVESLCSDWGVRRADRFKVVWARLPIPR